MIITTDAGNITVGGIWVDAYRGCRKGDISIKTEAGKIDTYEDESGKVLNLGCEDTSNVTSMKTLRLRLSC